MQRNSSRCTPGRNYWPFMVTDNQSLTVPKFEYSASSFIEDTIDDIMADYNLRSENEELYSYYVEQTRFGFDTSSNFRSSDDFLIFTFNQDGRLPFVQTFHHRLTFALFLHLLPY